MKFIEEFKKFISRGNVVDMAVGVIIATAFTAVVTALANKIIMPLVNWFLLAVTGQKGMESIYTYLHTAYKTEDGVQVIDLANSIYIDWGAFITAIIDFLLIALILFIILKIAMKSSSMLKNGEKYRLPNKQERAKLREMGVSFKDPKAVRAALFEMREKEKAEKEEAEKAKKEEEYKKSTEGLLTEIRDLLKKEQEKNKKDNKESNNDKQEKTDK